MVKRVNQNLAGRMNQYVEQRRERAAGKDNSFKETLSATKVESKKVAPKVRARRGGQVQTKKLPGRHITQVQAQRLAKYAGTIGQASAKYNVPIELVCAVILQESGGKSNAVSHCGARGLMQLMPATAKRLGVSNSFNPQQNIMGGTKYLRMLLDRFDGNVSLALAGYNAGEGNVEKYGRKIPPFKETQAYVPSVLKYADRMWHIFRAEQPIRRVNVRPPTTEPIRHKTIYSAGFTTG